MGWSADPSFTPTCSSQVPGYIADADKFAAKGVDGIYVVSVNDLFVVNAWKKSMNAPEKIKFGKCHRSAVASGINSSSMALVE